MSELFAFAAQQDGGQSSGSGLLFLLPYLLIFVVFYFLLIRPQQKERKRQEEETRLFRESLKNGDKVITSGGIYGVVTSVRDETVQVRIADAVKIEVLRSAIAGRQPEPGGSETK
jgi:preprotein translocase subunit YajC